MNIITGEKLQQLCDIYLGLKEDFDYNNLIKCQTNKHLCIDDINEPFNNPYYIFCYNHRINILSSKIQLFINDFILITHNSDGEIHNNIQVVNILNTIKLKKWYGQNICFNHDKLYFLPIGIANSMWSHGNIKDINIEITHVKSKLVYFNFNISTNKQKREKCFNNLNSKIPWLENTSAHDNIIRLKEYKFCICPEGNGVDTHRLWEALYLKVVPIVIKSEFTNILLSNNIPVMVLNDWNSFDANKLNYNDYNFNNIDFNKLINFNLNYFV